MNQQGLDLNLCTRRTRKMERLELKREEVQDIEVNWHIAMRPGKRRVLDKQSPLGAILDRIEQLKASIRAKVEHPFRVIKRQFGHTKVRYRGLAKICVEINSQEHGPTFHPVYALEPVDGEEAIFANHCMSASKYDQRVETGRQRGRISTQEASVSSKFASILSSSEFHHVKLALAVSFGHHP